MVENGRVYAIRYGNKLRVKRLSLRYDGALVIDSDNQSAAFKREIVPAEDLDNIGIIGRYVAHSFDGGDIRMRRIITLLFAITVPGVSFSAYTPKISESHSGFDNSRILVFAPQSGGCEKAFLVIDCSGFGLQWNSAHPDVMPLTAYTSGTRAILGFDFSIDGEKTSLDPVGPGYFSDHGDPLKQSYRPFTVSSSLIRKIPSAKTAWIRICFPDGCNEYDIKIAKDGTLVHRAITALLNKIDGIEPPVTSKDVGARKPSELDDLR